MVAESTQLWSENLSSTLAIVITESSTQVMVTRVLSMDDSVNFHLSY